MLLSISQKACLCRNELNAQKERFAEAERQRILREMQEKERQAQLARERAEQMAKPAEQKEPESVKPEEPVKTPEQPKASPDVLTRQKSEPAQTAAATPDKTAEPEPVCVTLKITGTPHQINSIMGYIKYCGASYTEV